MAPVPEAVVRRWLSRFWRAWGSWAPLAWTIYRWADPDLGLPGGHYRKGQRRCSYAELMFEPRDLWVGLYWTLGSPWHREYYLCLIPTVVLRVDLRKGWWRVW